MNKFVITALLASQIGVGSTSALAESRDVEAMDQTSESLIS
ncbi:MAG: hypothetical protein ABW170_01350 [Candidatus Thiodiazotropha sp. L084R]